MTTVERHWPEATLAVECAMVNPPRPLGFVVLLDGQPSAALTHDQLVAVLAEWDALDTAVISEK